MPKPPAGLVPLSSVPREWWVGLRVRHPMCQLDGTPYWRPGDIPPHSPAFDPDEAHPERYLYDIGRVVSHRRDRDFDGEEVTFRLEGSQSTLRYGDHNLWVDPRDLPPRA